MFRKPAIRLPLLASLTALLALASRSGAGPFRIAVIPDTQWASQKWPDLPRKMTEWIVTNRDQENIRHVLHVGDLVQLGHSETEWNNIDSAMRVLDGKVPYVVAVGNHDLDRLNPPARTTMFNRFFPVDRFKNQPGFGGNFPDGLSDNSFHTFEAGGKKWLILCLTFMPGEPEITWANSVVSRHPQHQVILLTHSYLTHTGRDVAGEVLWDRLVRHHPNMSMVFCGHLSTIHFRSEGDHGNTVCEMLFDWQNDVEPDPNGYFALITIDAGAGLITSRAYSPALDRELEGGRSGRTRFENVRFLPGDPKAAERAAAAAAAKTKPTEP